MSGTVPACRRCRRPTAPTAAAVVHAGGALDCHACAGAAASPLTWRGVPVVAAAGGGLVFTVPASGSRPARYFRLALDEVPAQGGAR